MAIHRDARMVIKSSRIVAMIGGGLFGLTVLLLGTRGRQGFITSERIVIEYPGSNQGQQGLIFVPASGERISRFGGALRTSASEEAIVRHIAGSSALPYLVADVDLVEDRQIVNRKLFQMDRTGKLGAEIRNSSRDVPMRSASISPDGRLLAYTYMLPPEVPRPILCVLDLRTSVSERLEAPQANAWSRHPLWSPDGKNLVYERVTFEGARAETTVLEYSLEKHTTRSVTSTLSHATAAVFISNTDLVVFCERGLVRVNAQGEAMGTILPYRHFEGLHYLGAGLVYLEKTQTIGIAFQDPSSRTVLFRIHAVDASFTRLTLDVFNVTSIGIV